MKRLLALIVCASLAASGCAARTSAAPGVPRAPILDREAQISVMRDYIKQLRIGSRVRVVQTNGTSMRAVLMKNDADPIVVQRRSRIP